MSGKKISVLREKWMEGLSWQRIGLIILGAAVCSFGIHNIHQRTGITEGGVIGLMLLAEHWLGFSPAFLTPVLDAACYLLAFKYLGGRFIRISVISTLSVSLFYKVWECFPPMLPDLSAYPLAAALLGGMFVGIGVGIIVRQGGSSGGDDALEMCIRDRYKVGKKKVYMSPSAAQAQGYERVSKYPKSTKFGRQNPITERWNSDEQLVLSVSYTHLDVYKRQAHP